MLMLEHAKGTFILLFQSSNKNNNKFPSKYNSYYFACLNHKSITVMV